MAVTGAGCTSGMKRDEMLLQLASVQHGAVSREQAATMGIDDETLRRRTRSCLLERRTARVWTVAGSPRTALQRLAIAQLDAGPAAATALASAGWLWRLPGYDERPLEVTRLREATSR